MDLSIDDTDANLADRFSAAANLTGNRAMWPLVEQDRVDLLCRQLGSLRHRLPWLACHGRSGAINQRRPAVVAHVALMTAPAFTGGSDARFDHASLVAATSWAHQLITSTAAPGQRFCAYRNAWRLVSAWVIQTIGWA
jgi:hypothetical protein